MKQPESFKGKIGRYLLALAILAILPAIVFSDRRATSTMIVGSEAPRRQRSSRPKPKSGTPTPVKTPSAFTSFKHETHGAPTTDLTCADCHTIPSREARYDVAAARKPGIKGYPYHDSCLRCHDVKRPQFFRGSTPSICTVCHTRSSPRLTARDIGLFPKQFNLTVRQFPGYFPHDKHCSVIIDVPEDKPCPVTSDVNKDAAARQDVSVKRVSCVDCHKRDQRPSKPILAGGYETLPPGEVTFKTSPNKRNDLTSAHSSCFECHLETSDEAKKPSKDNCRGCHRTPKEFLARKQPKKDSLLPLMSAIWFKDWPGEWPRRISAKFSHQGGKGEHITKCVTCHTDIAVLKTLDIPDVPIGSCGKCHLSKIPRLSDEMDDPEKEGIEDEEEDIKEGRNNNPASKEGKHTCSGCHTTLIGRAPPPCSHYLLFGTKYLSVKDYPKSAGQLAERCKK